MNGSGRRRRGPGSYRRGLAQEGHLISPRCAREQSRIGAAVYRTIAPSLACAATLTIHKVNPTFAEVNAGEIGNSLRWMPRALPRTHKAIALDRLTSRLRDQIVEPPRRGSGDAGKRRRRPTPALAMVLDVSARGNFAVLTAEAVDVFLRPTGITVAISRVIVTVKRQATALWAAFLRPRPRWRGHRGHPPAACGPAQAVLSDKTAERACTHRDATAALCIDTDA
jgi:hypothetical protein